MKDTRFSFLQYSIVLFGFWFWVLLIVFFVPSNVHAEGNNYYPYIISDYSDTYTSFANNNPDLISFFLSNSDVSNYISGHDYILYFPEVTSWRESSTITVLVDPVITGVPSLSESTSFTNTGFQVSGYTFSLGIYVDNGSFAVSSTSFYEPSTVIFLGNTSEDSFSGVNGFNNGSYFVNYPFYSTIDLSFDNHLLLSMGSGSSNPVISGSVVAPLFTGLTGGDIASGIPSLPSKPSINTYNPPSFNSSSITDSLNSIYDIVDYNLTYSTTLIVDYFDYFSSLIQYGFKSIIDNIQNGIQNIFDNFNSLFSPILNGIAEKISYISEPIDSQTITQGIGNYEIFTDINAFKIIHDDFEDMVTNTSEPESFLIPVHIEKISYFSDVPTQYIDLQVLHDLPVLKPFCWVVVSVGLILIVASGLPQMLYGGDANGK